MEGTTVYEIWDVGTKTGMFSNPKIFRGKFATIL